MTRFETFEAIKAFAMGNVLTEEQVTEVVEFCTKEQAAIERKNEKARERSAAKRAAGDALRERIEAVLGADPKTINEIMETLGDEDLTPSKIVSRLNQLVKAERVVKEHVSVDGRKLMAYRIA